MAGNSSKKAKNDNLEKPAFIYIDANDTLYVCDKDAHAIRMFTKDGNGSMTIANSSSGLKNPEGIVLDDDGFLYVTRENDDQVFRYSADFSSVRSVAGQSSSSGNGLDELNKPLGLAIDNNSNLYIAERDNKRVMKWTPNATSGTMVINAASYADKLYGLLLSREASDQVYVSSKEKDAVYLWTFGSTTPNVTLTRVINSTDAALKDPIGIKYDKYGNLYVADQGHKRVVMYCSNSTDGRVVVDGDFKTPELKKVVDIALDSDLNLYISDEDLKQIFKYYRL